MTKAAQRMAAPPDLVTEATRKAGLIWLGIPGRDRAEPIWHHWVDGIAYVISSAERPLPELRDGALATVTVRSRTTGERLVSWLAEAGVVRPGSAEWEHVLPGLSAKRLNAKLAPAGESVLIRLARTGLLATLE